MKVLFKLKVDKLYNLVRRKQVNSWSPAIHYHVDCGQSFACLWPSVSAGMGRIVDPYLSNEFFCPQCGGLINTNTTYIAEASGSESVPLDLELTVIDRGSIIDVKFEYHTIYVDGDLQTIYPGYKPYLIDILRFDFKQRKVFLVQKKRTRSDIISEITPNISGLYADSLPLRWIVATRNCRLSEHKSELKEFAKVLKQAYFSKLSRKVGYKVKPILQSVRLSDRYGALNVLLHNLAWKMHAPDAPALNESLISDFEKLTSSFGRRSEETLAITELTNSGVPFIKALINVYKLPDKRWVRRLLTLRPFYFINVITLANNAFASESYKRAFVSLFESNEGARSTYIQAWPIWDVNDHRVTITNFLTILRHQYGERRALLFIKNAESYSEIKDSAYMYFRLSRAQRKEIWGRNIQIKFLHDEIMCMQKFNDEINVPVQKGEPYRKLIDTIDNLTFAPVQSTHDIIRLGVTLNNCVATYIEKVKDGSCAIVGVFDKGRPVACIEVTPTKDATSFISICQAKLKNNRPARSSHTVNYAICQWADRHHLRPASFMNDIQFAKGGAM